MRWLIASVLGLFSVFAQAEQSQACLSVSDNNVEELRADYGMTTVKWSAHVANRCDASYDGTLKVRFLDDKGEVLHESLEIVILQQNGSEDASRRITLPTDQYDKYAQVDVVVEERKRPT